MSNWVCLQRPENSSVLFLEMLEGLEEGSSDVKHVVDKLREDRLDLIDAGKWESTCELVLENVSDLVKKSDARSGNLIFASAQQISSVLRTNLTCEVHSRLSADWPEI